MAKFPGPSSRGRGGSWTLELGTHVTENSAQAAAHRKLLNGVGEHRPPLVVERGSPGRGRDMGVRTQSMAFYLGSQEVEEGYWDITGLQGLGAYLVASHLRVSAPRKHYLPVQLYMQNVGADSIEHAGAVYGMFTPCQALSKTLFKI